MTEALPNIETLLSHQDWVRALARGLIADPARADDVAQQAMLEAVTRAPQDLREPKGWLARVVRNAALALQRQERRRQRREQVVAVAKAEAVAPDPAAMVQRAAAHKRVVDVLFALPEPYHTVVLLRYFEDIDAREIAHRLDRSLATVRTQLQRGLERMRQQLDGEFGSDRAAWCAALMPLFATPKAVIGVPLLTTIGAMLMTKWILIAATLVATWLFGQWCFEGAAMPVVPGAGGGTVAAVAPEMVSETPADDLRRELVPVAAATVSPVADSAPSTAPALRGRIVAPDGTALVGITVARQDPAQPRLRGDILRFGMTSIDLSQPSMRDMLGDEAQAATFAAQFGPHADAVLAMLRGQPIERPRAISDGSGRFAFDLTFDIDELVIESSSLLSYGTGKLPGDPEVVLVAGPAVNVAGRVHDEHGAAIADAYVHLGYQLDALPGIGARLHDTHSFHSWNAQSAADGSFELGLVPAHAALSVTVQKRGYNSKTVATVDVTGPVDCTLRKAPPSQSPTVQGIVRHVDGRPAAGARVDFGQDGGQCGDDGRFSFQLTASKRQEPLTAWLPGLQPCVLKGLGARLRDDPAAGAELELRLGAEALAITGRVLDVDGRAVKGVRVVADGATFLGSSDQLLENMIGGQRKVTTDADGRFELRGLADRDYRVRAVHPRTLLVIESEPITAGTSGVELRQSADAFIERLEGVVVDRFGLPVVGADVSLSAMLLVGPSMSKSMPRRDGVKSGDNGQFVIERCPRSGVQLVVSGDGLKWSRTDVSGEAGLVRIEIVRRLRFRLHRQGGVAASAFEVRDEFGEVMTTTLRRPASKTTYRRVPIRSEQPVCEVDDRAVRIVLFDGKREVLTQPLVLLAGDVTEVAY